jgi:aminopeptidase N
MIFTPSSPLAPDYTPEVHTQGQTETNRHWFVCHDHPNERMTTELIVDVPSGLSVSSNGRLVSLSDDGRRAVWHYLQDKPHVSYLVTLVIGTFEIVELPHERVPMTVWVPPGLGEQVPACYGRTGRMIDVFEERFGVAYPWARYDQILAKNFRAGGMENTSATTMYPTAILDETALREDTLEGLIAHELAHQWTGDLYTCRSWAHIWLNEGWATYAAALWYEHVEGLDGYLDQIRGNFGVAERDRTTNELPMVSPIYESSWEPFGRKANPYPKGSAILHMLRMMLGDDVFFEGTRLFMNRHALDVVETSDFRYAMEEVSGLGLEWFFEQWCYRPGTPELKVQVRYEPEPRELLVDIEQVQQIDERTPAFRFELPILVRTAGSERTSVIDVRERTTSFRTTLDGPPTLVAVDPNLHVLKTITVEKPLNLWLAQAGQGPTIAARHAAVRALGGFDTPETVTLLREITLDESVRWTLRVSAVEAMAKLASQTARESVLTFAAGGVADPRVRVQALRSIRDDPAETAVPVLAEAAAGETSYGCRVAAIEGLAHFEAAENADVIASLVHVPSQHEQVRQAALRALAKLDDERGLSLGMRYAAYGHMDRARPAAIAAIGKLAHHDLEAAVDYLLALLDDPEWRTVDAAGTALAETGDKRAVPPLEAISRSHPDPERRKRAGEWVKKLTEANTTESE